MAGQDFAQIEVPQPEDVRPMKQSKVLLLTVTALCVVAGGFVVGFLVGHEMGIQKATSDDDERLQAKLKQQQMELATLRANAKKRSPDVSTTQVGELTFYNELPKQSVDPEPLQMNSGQPQNSNPNKSSRERDVSKEELKQIIEQELNQKRDPKTNGTLTRAEGEYFLQVGSFQKQSDADIFFPKLKKSGFPGVIKRVKLPALGTWYRVYVGPFDTKEASEKAKIRVKSSLNITGLIVKGG